MHDPINWTAGQLGTRQEQDKPRQNNPRPAGVIRSGSGTDVLLRYLRHSPGRWFYHYELVMALGRSKGEIDWALQFLRDQRHIKSEEVALPGRKSVFRYSLCK